MALNSRVPRVYKLPGSARPRNRIKLSSYNSRKVAIERSRRRQQHIKNLWPRRQRRSDSVSVRTLRWRRKRGLRKPPARRSSNPNNKLSQHRKKLRIGQVQPHEQPHEAPSKKKHRVVVLLGVEMVLRLHQRPLRHRPKRQHAAGKLRHQQNLIR